MNLKWTQFPNLEAWNQYIQPKLILTEFYTIHLV